MLSFTVEVHAVLMAVKKANFSRSEVQNLIVFADSSTVLSWLQQLMPTHPLVPKVLDCLVLLHSPKCAKVDFCCIPAHVDVEGF